MEFDSVLTITQGHLHSLEKSLGDLKCIEFADDKTATVIQAVKQIITKASKNKELVEIERKIHLYLVLNTDFPIQDALTEDENLGLFINTAPTISKNVLVAIVHGCGLLQYACESLIFCESVLSVQYLDALIANLEYLEIDSMLDTFRSLIAAIFLKLVHLSNGVDKCQPRDSAYIKNKFRSYLITLSCKLKTCIQNKVTMETEIVQFEYAGKLAYTLLTLLNECLENFKNPKSLDWYSKSNIEYDYNQWEEQNVDLSECLDLIAIECKNNLKDLTFEAWMALVEFPYGDSGKSLQNAVSHAAYASVQNLESTTPSSEIILELMAGLKPLSSKPRDEDDEIVDADIHTILCCIEDSSKTQAKWVAELLKREDGLSTTEAIESLKSHLNLLPPEATITLLNRAIAGSSEDNALLKETAYCAFLRAPLTDKPELIDQFFGQHQLCDFYKTSMFDSVLTSVLNRAVNLEARRDKWLPDLLALCLQSPQQLVERAVIEGIASRSQGTLMAAALTEIKSVCAMQVVGQDMNLLMFSLDQAMAKLDPTTTQICHLVITLEERGLFDKAKFIKRCLMPALNRDLKEYKIPHLQVWLQLLKRLLKVDTPQIAPIPGINLAIILRVLSEVLAKASWVLGKFRQAESLLRSDTMLLVRPLACRMANSCTPEDKDLLWLRASLLKLTSHNRSHFSPLWTHFGCPVPSMNLGSLLLSRDAMCHQPSMPPGGPDQLLSPLLILLPTCCTAEWRLLTSSLTSLLAHHANSEDEEQLLPEVLRLLVTTLMLQALMLNQTQPDDSSFSNDCALACLENSVRNLGIIMKEEWLPQLSVSGVTVVEAGAGVVRQVALLLRSLPTSLAGSCSLALSAVLMQAQEVLLVQAESRPELVTWCAHELALSLALLPDRDSRQALSRKLLLEPATAQL